MLRNILTACVVLLLGGLVVFMAGCNNQGNDPQAGAHDTAAKGPPVAVSTKPGGTAPGQGEEHGHKPGQHGGIMVSIGSDNYHAEAVFEKGGILRLYMLDRDESKLLEVEKQTLTGYVKIEGDTEAESFELNSLPQTGDAADKTSQFMGKLPSQFAGKRVEVTIPVLRIGKERFRIGFKSASEIHKDADMPAGAMGEDARKLYLTPGGKYTAEDIKANGGMTADEKFKGVMASHDLKPKPGDKICPITLTKANPKFTWVVGGKAYEFCCPPCVDEFVKMAKETPAEVLPPEDYVKK